VPIDNWTATQGIACPSVRLCVAVDETGDIAWSSRPARKWSVWFRNLGGGPDESDWAVACASPRMCVITNSSGHVLVSRSPAGRHWTKYRMKLVRDSAPVVACSHKGSCYISGGPGVLLVANRPWLGAHSWKRATIPKDFETQDMACPSRTECVGVGGRSVSGNWIPTTITGP
jgi:hypothetical protein